MRRTSLVGDLLSMKRRRIERNSSCSLVKLKRMAIPPAAHCRGNRCRRGIIGDRLGTQSLARQAECMANDTGVPVFDTTRWPFDNSYARLPERFYARLPP